MNAAYHKFVQDVSYRAKIALDQEGPLTQLNILWAGVPNYDALITQGEIDSDPNYAAAGLTTQNLADAAFAMAAIKTAVDNALPALTILANLP